jgi:hypothetical protein
MTAMTKQDIIDHFSDTTKEGRYYSTPGEAAMYNDWQQPDDWENVTSKSVDHYGGEDCGSTYYTVYQFIVDGNEVFYLRFDGWYASHYGCEYQDFREVFSRQVTKTEYV